MYSIDEADERLILEKLTNELNQKFGLGLDVNFSLSREGNSNMEDALNDSPEEGFILMGSSRAFRLAAALNSHGDWRARQMPGKPVLGIEWGKFGKHLQGG